jgi:hypothetical protein
MATAMLALSETVYQHTKLNYRVTEAARIRIAHINGCQMFHRFRVVSDLQDLLEQAGGDEQANVSDGRGEPPSEEFYAAVETGVSRTCSRTPSVWRSSSRSGSLSIPAGCPPTTSSGISFTAPYDGEIVDLTHCITTRIATGRFPHVLGFAEVCAVPSRVSVAGSVA